MMLAEFTRYTVCTYNYVASLSYKSMHGFVVLRRAIH